MNENYLLITKEELDKAIEELYKKKESEYDNRISQATDEKEKANLKFWKDQVRKAGYSTEELPEKYQYVDSFFPNNFLNDCNLFSKENKKRILNSYYCYKKLLDDSSTKETDLTFNFLYKEENRLLLMGIIDRFGEAHHALCRYAFPEFLKGKADFVPDVLLIGHDSNGYHLFFVEFESPYGTIVSNKGKNFGETIRKGINQITDWKRWIPQHYNQISEELDKHAYEWKQKPKELGVYREPFIHYVVVAGRRKDYETSEIKQLIEETKKNDNIHVMNYDSFAEIFISQRACISKNDVDKYIYERDH